MDIILNTIDDRTNVGLLLSAVLMVMLQMNVSFYNIFMSEDIKLSKSIQMSLIPIIFVLLSFLLFNIYELNKKGLINKVSEAVMYALLGFTEKSPLPESLMIVLGKIFVVGILITFVFPIYGLLNDPVSKKLTT